MSLMLCSCSKRLAKCLSLRPILSAFFISVSTWGASLESRATPLALEDILRSTIAHHPLIVAATADREQAATAELAAQGGFDWMIEQESQFRTSGFYDGWFVDQKVVKPIPQWNSKVSLGYRLSDGELPIYENYYNTLSGGEINLGVSWSLLQNRTIDEKRVKLANSTFQLDAAKEAEKLARNSLLFDAANYYLMWYRHAQRLKILRLVLRLAQDREKAIKARVANGDVASITLTEFQTTLLSRQAAVMQAQQSLKVTSWQLSLYWRDSEGKPLYPADSLMPEALSHERLDSFILDSNWEQRILSKHPKLKQLSAEINTADNELKLAQNRWQPQLDFEIKVREDLGSGSSSLNGTESYVGLAFSMPIERRRAEADIQKAKAKLKALKSKQLALEQEIHADLEAARTRIKYLREMMTINREQAKVATKLTEQENRRFNAGDSDLFLVNARDVQSGNAQISALDAEVNLINEQLKMLWLSVELETLLR